MYELTRSRQYTANDKRSSNDFVAIEHKKKIILQNKFFTSCIFQSFLHPKFNVIILFQ